MLSSQETQLAPAETTPLSTRTCSRCNSPAGPTGSFCQHCGAPLEDASSQQPAAYTENPVSSPVTDQTTTEENAS
jgi:predicted amidophosphoribosyltransferase